MLTRYLVAFALLVVGCSAASNWYIAPDGNDGGNGSIDTPFLTLGKALSVARDDDTIFVRAGTYLGAGNINLRSSRDVTIIGESPSTTIFDGVNGTYYQGGPSFLSTTSVTILVNVTVKNYATSFIIQAGSVHVDSCVIRSAQKNFLMADISGATFLTLKDTLVGDVTNGNGNRRVFAIETQCRNDITTQRTVTTVNTYFNALAGIVATDDTCDSNTRDVWSIDGGTWTGEQRWGFVIQSGTQFVTLSNAVVQSDNPAFTTIKSATEIVVVNVTFSYGSDVVQAKSAAVIHIYDSKLEYMAGAAIEMVAGGRLTMSGCDVRNNNGFGGSGGGVHLGGGADAYITNTVFTNNNSPSIGGVFSTSEGSELTAYDCTFRNNHAVEADAGVVDCATGAQVTFINNKLSNNTAAGEISFITCHPGCVFTSINNEGDGAEQTC